MMCVLKSSFKVGTLMMEPCSAVHLIEELDPALGPHVNLAIQQEGSTSFSSEVRCVLLPNLDILGAPIGLFQVHRWEV